MRNAVTFPLVLLLGTVLSTLTTPSEAAALSYGSDARPMSEQMASLRELLRQLESVRQTVAGFTNPEELAGSQLAKCGTVAQTCSLDAECCLPMVCHRRVPLNLAVPNNGIVLGKCGIVHYGR